jgi:hypothetical protein
MEGGENEERELREGGKSKPKYETMERAKFEQSLRITQRIT